MKKREMGRRAFLGGAAAMVVARHVLGSASATRSVEDRVPAREHGDEG